MRHPKFKRNLLIGIAFVIGTIFAARYVSGAESDYVAALASKYNARQEVRLWDGTRPDLVNREYAFEVDYARKWAEGIGQAIYYAQLTGKKPALILLTHQHEQRLAYRAQTAGAAAGVRVIVERIPDGHDPRVDFPDRGDSDSIDIKVGPLDIVIPQKATPHARSGIAKVGDAPVRAYMLQSRGQYMTSGLGGVRSWGPQNKADIWTDLEKCRAVKKSMLGRGREAVIEAFLLLPVEMR